jgi:hypothetical protein
LSVGSLSSGQAPDLADQRLGRGRRGDPHEEHEAVLAGHRVAGLDLGEAGEPVGNVVLVVVVEWRDRDEGREREAERLGIDGAR